MKYSRKRIDKAGDIISSKPVDILQYAEAMSIVDDWRKLHLPLIEMLMNQLNEVFVKSNIKPVFSSQRLKRMVSIQEKLQRTSGMGLGGVQDIGGGRFVFNDIPTLFKAKECILQASFRDFTLDHEAYDYVQTPKDSGYRSIHFVFKYHSDGDDKDGMRVELQIRTKLQHDWATAVETAELVSQSHLKASVGDENWLEFFKIVSAIFAIRESSPVNKYFEHYTEENYCRKFTKLDSENKFIDKLQALVGVVDFAETNSFSGGYALVLINYVNKEVSMRHFMQEQKDLANDIYAKTESEIRKEEAAAVLVAVSDVKELREAYPSYFLNANEFISALDEFQKRCKLKGYIA